MRCSIAIVQMNCLIMCSCAFCLIIPQLLSLNYKNFGEFFFILKQFFVHVRAIMQTGSASCRNNILMTTDSIKSFHLFNTVFCTTKIISYLIGVGTD